MQPGNTAKPRTRVKPLADAGPGVTWEHKSRVVDELAAAIEVGHLVYTPPCDTMTTPPAKRYDARRGRAPGFAELRSKLAERGIALEYSASFYWRAVAMGAS